jgi:hypothetical protein
LKTKSEVRVEEGREEKADLVLPEKLMVVFNDLFCHPIMYFCGTISAELQKNGVCARFGSTRIWPKFQKTGLFTYAVLLQLG